MHQKNYLFFIVFFFATGSFAQTASIRLLAQFKNLPANFDSYARKGQTAVFDTIAAQELLRSKPKAISFSFNFENREWVVALKESDLLSKDFFITSSSNPASKYKHNNGIMHYKGFVKDKPNSFAAISVFPDGLVAVIADEKGNINIGAINTPNARLSNEHIIYRETDLLIPNMFSCNTAVAAASMNTPVPVYTNSVSSTVINDEPVDIYFEADFTTYNNNGANVANTVNYVTALFNVVNTLYERDSINTKISAIKVWNTPDPYTALATSSAVLSAFATSMSNGFPGDLASFLSQRGLGGGVAYVNGLCSNNYYKSSVCGNLSNSFGLFPVYSWSVMVVAHELGHSIGSQHTQWCGWPGGAIDNCYTTEYGCAAGPAPANGGTIMSYCHLTGYGINLSNGFGPHPAAVLRNQVRTGTCHYPGVYFESTLQNVVEEEANVENGCFDYKIFTTKLKIPYKPTQPANITLVPLATAGLVIGTNKDIEITPLNFVLDSANLSQTIQFKVYDDALIEDPETLALNFNINANGGNAIKRAQSFEHITNITGLDHQPDSSTNEILFYEPFDGIVGGLGNWVQTIVYGNASANRWVINNSGNIEFPSKALYVSNNGTALAYNGTTAADSAILRIESPAFNAAGFSSLVISYLYKCLGEYVVVNGVGLTPLDYGKLFYSVNNGNTWALLKDNIMAVIGKNVEIIEMPENANNAVGLKFAFEWRNNSTVVRNPPLIIDSLVIKGRSVTPIQTTAHPGNVVEAYLGPNQTVHYYNPITKNIIATIENKSAFDFGCTKVELLRTGASAVTGWGITPSEKISSKAFKVTPANANAAAPYNITFYYTNAEINGWLSATGNTVADLSIVKTNGDITQTPPATPAQFSGSNGNNSYGSMGHVALKASFTGFSTFAAMKPFVVPVCATGNPLYVSDIPGTAYQWQVNTGSGYTNIANGIVYSGATADTLKLTNPPTAWYGNLYRCNVTTTQGVVNTPVFTLKFGMSWLGTVSTAWENPLNWSCGTLPDANTDVIIYAGTPFAPRINAGTTIRTLKLHPGANVVVASGTNLMINK
jgi:Metallo-peptidase family M12/Reprolysin family propeptide